MALGVVVAVVELCKEIAQDGLGVGESQAVVLVVGRIVAVAERQVGGSFALVVDDVGEVEALVLVVAHRAVEAQAHIS